jgi:ATP-binding cassette subfamily F protein uup
LLVSHDRTFLNNVVTSTIVLEGEGRLQEYVGGYDDWLRQRVEIKETSKEAKTKREKQPKEKSKLSFKETRELEDLPQKIEEMEQAKSELLELLNSTDFYKTNHPDQVMAVHTKLEIMEADLTVAYTRWNELEELAAIFGSRS